MSRVDLERTLADYDNTKLTVKLVPPILGSIPFAPPNKAYADLVAACELHHADAPEGVLERAIELAADKPVADAMKVANVLDTSSTGLSIFTGLQSAMALFGGGSEPVKAAVQQKADAAMKAIGLGFAVHRLFPEGLLNRIEVVQSLAAGRTLLVYYGAVEVALPFVVEVNADESHHFVTQLVRKHSSGPLAKLAPAIGQEGLKGAQGALGEMLGLLDKVVDHTIKHIDAIAGHATQILPKSFGKGSAAELVATGADALPVYQWLVARLVAESLLYRAREELDPDFPPPPPEPLPESDDPFAQPTPPPTDPFALPETGEAGSDVNPFAAPAADANPFAQAPAADTNPFAQAPAADTNPFAQAPAADTNPFAPAAAAAVAATAATAAATANPFAEAPAADVNPFAAAPPEPVPAPPTRPGTSTGAWARGTRLLVLSPEGADSAPVGLADLTGPAGPAPACTEDGDGLLVEGERWEPALWDLTGEALEGTWSDGTTTLTLQGDGTCTGTWGEGFYALGPGSIRLRTPGGEHDLPFLSTLLPQLTEAAVVFVGDKVLSRA